MLFENVSYVDENMCVQDNMYIGIQGEHITYISDKPPLEKSVFGEIRSNLNNKMLLPGFYNPHSHMPMSLLRGYGEGLSLQDWLFKKIFPFEAKMNARDIYSATILAAAEMLRFGIVSCTDMYYFGHEMGQAFMQAGVKANFAVTCSFASNEEYNSLAHYKQTVEMVKEFGNNSRLIPEIALHAEYTTNENTARGVALAAKELGIATQVHVSETKKEVEECRQRHNGATPVKYLAQCGIFDVRSTAAHCVHITEEDRDILKEHNVSVVTCPKSNLKLASGVCNVGALLKKGINVAVGTDSVASNNNLNYLEELKFFKLLSCLPEGRADELTIEQALYAGTRAGAIAQGREDCGIIQVGNRADIIMMDLDKVYLKPQRKSVAEIIYSGCGTDVCMTMVDGKVLYDNGEYSTIDIEKAEFEAQKSIDRILNEL